MTSKNSYCVVFWGYLCFFFPQGDLSLDQIFFAVKTTKKYHKSRGKSVKGSGNSAFYKKINSATWKEQKINFLHLLFGRGPNRVMKTACFDANVP